MSLPEALPPDDDPKGQALLKQYQEELLADPKIARHYERFRRGRKPISRRTWLKIGGVMTAGVAIGAIIVHVVGENDREQQAARQKTYDEALAVHAVLEDPRYLGGLGLCAVELRTQAKLLRLQPDADPHGAYLSPEAYDRAAFLAEASQTPCEAPSSSVLRVFVSDGSLISVPPNLVTLFDVPTACTSERISDQVNVPNDPQAATRRAVMHEFVDELGLRC